MKKLLIGISISSFLFLTGIASSYFEGRYRCNIQSDTITISMNTGQQKCFGYLATLTSTLAQVDSDLLQATNYINRGTDVDYWTTIQGSLVTQKASLESKRRQAVLAIDDFERALFNQIKSLLKFYLSEQRTEVLESVDGVRDQLVSAKESGNALLFQQYLITMESLQVKLFLLDRIQFAHDFEELVPFLKEYLYGGGQL